MSLPKSVETLLRDHLRSFEQLEVLLLMRTRSEESWTVDSIGAELRLDPQLLSDALSGLEASGFLVGTTGNPPRYQYQVVRAALAHAVDELVSACREQRAAVMSRMSTNAIERIRSGSLKAWADAFVIRRRKDDG